MRKVFKYQIENSVELPIGSEVLKVDTQGGTATMWCLVDPEAALEKRHFLIVGTGWDVPSNTNHIGSWLEFDGAFVWHLFEVFT